MPNEKNISEEEREKLKDQFATIKNKLEELGILSTEKDATDQRFPNNYETRA